MIKSIFLLLVLSLLSSAEPVTIRLMLIGWPLMDSKHSVSQQPIYGIDTLLRAFEKENPDIKVEFMPAQWGSGASAFLSKTRALILSNAVDVIEMCGVNDFANQGTIDNIEPWINNDPDFDSTVYISGMLDRWPAYILKEKQFQRFCLPLYCGVRLTGYDRTLFNHFGVDTLSSFPTPQEILDKAAKLTGIDPVTGKKVYGIFFQGRVKYFLFYNALTAFNAEWTAYDKDGWPRFVMTTKAHEDAVVWLLKVSKYAPASLMSVGDEYEAIWGTLNNYTAIRLQSFTHSLYNTDYIPGAKLKDGSQRFRYVHPFRDSMGGGGFTLGSGLSLVSGSKHKKEGWRLLKWLSMSPVAQSYMARNINGYPVIKKTYDEPVFQKNENFKTALHDLSLPVNRFAKDAPIGKAIENGLDKALVRARETNYDTTVIRTLAREFLADLNKEFDTWLLYEKKYPPDAMVNFSLSRFAIPFFSFLLGGLIILGILGRKHFRNYGVWFLFLLPSLIGMIVFLAYPIAESFRLSVFRSNGFMEMYAGLANYSKVIQDPDFHKSLFNTIYIGLSGLTLGIPIGFILASFINSQKKAQTAFKVLYFLPMVTSVIASVIIFKYLFEPDFGIVNAMLNKLHIPTQGLVWLNSPQTSKLVVIFFSLWQGTGYTVLICLAGLQAIPDQLYEAASIDGCNELQKWWHITLPNMRPTFVFLFMTGCIAALKRFEDVFTLGGMQGSPAGSLKTSVGYIFEQAFGIFNFGTASAAAYLLFAIILVITLINYRALLRKEM